MLHSVLERIRLRIRGKLGMQCEEILSWTQCLYQYSPPMLCSCNQHCLSTIRGCTNIVRSLSLQQNHARSISSPHTDSQSLSNLLKQSRASLCERDVRLDEPNGDRVGLPVPLVGGAHRLPRLPLTHPGDHHGQCLGGHETILDHAGSGR